MQLERKGELKGRVDGIESGIKKVAFNLIKEGFDNHLINSVTGLNFSQIKYLRTQENYDIDAELN